MTVAQQTRPRRARLERIDAYGRRRVAEAEVNAEVAYWLALRRALHGFIRDMEACRPAGAGRYSLEVALVERVADLNPRFLDRENGHG